MTFFGLADAALDDLMRHGAQYRVDAGAADTGNHMYLVATGFLQRCALLGHILFGNRVHLVQGHNLGLVFEAMAIGFQLGADGLVRLGHRIAGAVDQVQDGGAAFGMAQEPIAQPNTFMRAFNQSRQVGSTKSVSSIFTTPSCGSRVVKG